MNNTQMTPQQAAQEVIKLKKEYENRSKSMEGFHNSAVAKEISSRAEALRNQYGLDANKYGSGATLADAYTNYYNDFGASQQANNVQQTPVNQVQQTQEPDRGLDDIIRLLEESTRSGLDSQKSQYDRILESQLAELDKMLADAVSEGEMSVKEAEKAFQEKKSEIEKLAYQQSTATRGYANDMGMQHSNVSIGMMAGDNARINNIHNANMSDRDRRIADIKDRVNLIKQKKAIDESRYRMEHGYNIAGAEAQANQAYMQQMAQLMGQDYFAKQGYAHEEKMFDKDTDRQYGLLDKQQEFTRENIHTEFLNKVQLTEFESDLRINEMVKGHELKLDELEKILFNDLKKMEVGHQYNVELTNLQIDGQIRAASISANAQLQAARENRQAQLDALKRSVTPGTDEYKAAELEIERQAKLTTEKIMAETRAGIATSLVMDNPNLPAPGSQYDPLPWDYRQGFPNANPSKELKGQEWYGNLLNKITGYDKKKEEHVETIKARAALERFLGDYDYGIPWATEKKK